MPEWIAEGQPWALAASLVAVHSWFLTRPVIRQWRDCEADKRLLREEHREMRAEMVDMAGQIVRLKDRIHAIENGGQ